MSTGRDFRPGGRDSNPGWARHAVPYINGWINETEKALALEGDVENIAKLVAGLKKLACSDLTEAVGPVPEVAQVMDVTLAKSAEQNYAFKGKRQYQPPGKPTKDSKTVEGPGAFEGTGNLRDQGKGRGRRPDVEKALINLSSKLDRENPPLEQAKAEIEKEVSGLTLPDELKRGMIQKLKAHDMVKGMKGLVGHLANMGLAFGTGRAMDESKVDRLKSSMDKLSKLLEHWGKPGNHSAVAEEDAPAADPVPPMPHRDLVALDPDGPWSDADINSAIKDRLSHGVAEGVINSLAEVFTEPIDFANPDVLSVLDIIERQYTQKGRKFFTQLRAEVADIGPINRDEMIRKAVRVFRELA